MDIIRLFNKISEQLDLPLVLTSNFSSNHYLKACNNTNHQPTQMV